MSQIRQPSTEAVLGTPLQLREEQDETVVEVLSKNDRLVELKRFNDQGNGDD